MAVQYRYDVVKSVIRGFVTGRAQDSLVSVSSRESVLAGKASEWRDYAEGKCA